jgi:hypothetical protein
MGPPGFEPESQAPKAQRIDQATLWSPKTSKLYFSLGLEPRTGIEPATTRLQVSRSTRLSYRGILGIGNVGLNTLWYKF